jgi:uncharacterized protein YndB with AHSA1/START domain
MSEPITREITITRIVDAPRELVFAAWTEAERLAAWWGPEGFTAPSVESDPRPGGAFSIVMRGPDGVDYPMWGTYRELEPPHRLVADVQAAGADGVPALEAVTTLTLEDRDGKTELTVHERATTLIPEGGPMLGGMEAGMAQSLRKLDDVLTGAVDRQIVIARMIEAPRERVFDAWTSPEQLERWWGPNGFTVTTQEIDVRPGATWRFTMHGPDGVDHPNQLDYEAIEAPETLAYLHTSPGADDPAFRSTVTFDDVMGMTVLTMRGVFATAEARDRVVERYDAIEGGKQTLDRLAAHVTKASVG